MTIPHVLPTATNAPLPDQRRGLWDRARAVFGGRRSDRGSAVLPADALVESQAQPARYPQEPQISSAATESAIVRRITGEGSGPYSGTPFLVVPRSTDPAHPRAADEPCEAARHDHGIIDQSRHVSSIGRR
jgi:hypothetical protein